MNRNCLRLLGLAPALPESQRRLEPIPQLSGIAPGQGGFAQFHRLWDGLLMGTGNQSSAFHFIQIRLVITGLNTNVATHGH